MRFLILVAALLLLQLETLSADDNKSLLQAQEAGAALIRGQYEKAIALYGEVLKTKDVAPAQKASFYNDRGVAKWRLLQFKEAIKDFNNAIESYPEFASAYNNRGNVLLEISYPEEAIKDFDRAITLARGYGPAYNNRANAYTKIQQYDKAVQDYAKAIEFMPTNAVPFNGRGKAHLAKNRHHAAKRDFSRAISLNAKYISAYINRAQAWIGLKEYNSAIKDLDFAISSNPDAAGLYAARGHVHQARNKFRPAYKDYTKAISLNNSDAAAYSERGAINVATGEFENAVTDLSYAIQIEPGLATAYAERASAHFSTGMTEEALPDAEKAIKLDPNNPRAYFVRAQIYETIGDIAKALSDYKKSFELDPKQKETRTALERLNGEVIIPVVPKIGEPLDGWEIARSRSGEFIASNIKYDSIYVPLEMYGPEEPKLLEWTALKQDFKGIGLLRYYAGTAKLPDTARVEHIAVIDLYNKKVAAIEPFKWGVQKSKWDWKEGGVVVTDHQGTVNEITLRKPRYIARDQWGKEGYWWGQPSGDGWVYRNGKWSNRSAHKNRRRKRKRKKSFFESLFN